jgi:hypothetical protein
MFSTEFTTAHRLSLSWWIHVVLSTHFIVILPSAPRSFKWPLTFTFSYCVCVCVCVCFSPIRATSPAHLVLFHLVTLVTFGEQYNSWRPLRCLLQSPVTASLFVPNISLRTLFCNTPACVHPSLAGTRFHTRMRQQAQLYVFMNTFSVGIPLCLLTDVYSGVRSSGGHHKICIVTSYSAIHVVLYVSTLFCREGDKPQNINFTGEARRWLCFTYDKCFER